MRDSCATSSVWALSPRRPSPLRDSPYQPTSRSLSRRTDSAERVLRRGLETLARLRLSRRCLCPPPPRFGCVAVSSPSVRGGARVSERLRLGISPSASLCALPRASASFSFCRCPPRSGGPRPDIVHQIRYHNKGSGCNSTRNQIYRAQGSPQQGSGKRCKCLAEANARGSGKSCKTKCLITLVFDIFSSLRFLPRQLNGPLENAPYQRKIE